MRDTLVFEDANGNHLLKLQERMVRVRDTMNISDNDGNTVATVKKAMIAPLRERWSVDVKGAPDIKVQGNIVDHEYTLESDGGKVAEVSKRWFRVADTYGVEVEPGQNVPLILAITAVVDQMAHRTADPQRRSSARMNEVERRLARRSTSFTCRRVFRPGPAGTRSGRDGRWCH